MILATVGMAVLLSACGKSEGEQAVGGSVVSSPGVAKRALWHVTEDPLSSFPQGSFNVTVESESAFKSVLEKGSAQGVVLDGKVFTVAEADERVVPGDVYCFVYVYSPIDGKYATNASFQGEYLNIGFKFYWNMTLGSGSEVLGCGLRGGGDLTLAGVQKAFAGILKFEQR